MGIGIIIISKTRPWDEEDVGLEIIISKTVGRGMCEEENNNMEDSGKSNV